VTFHNKFKGNRPQLQPRTVTTIFSDCWRRSTEDAAQLYPPRSTNIANCCYCNSHCSNAKCVSI